MTTELKPLIFVEPLSDTLKKLKEVMEEGAEGEGIEIYEATDLAEVQQLLPSIGQCLLLCASPKKTAQILQQNRKINKSEQNKIIMLSGKSIPRKTLDKFMKIGLTECVNEPVNPKTLMYKVRLQLRSIKTISEEKEMARKFDENGDGAQENEDIQKKLGKGHVVEEALEEDEKLEKKIHEEVKMENYSKVSKKELKEEAIDGFYRGKKSKNTDEEQEEDSSPRKSNYQEEAIDTHYSGTLNTSEVEVEEEVPKERMPEIGDVEADELEELRQRLDIEVEEDIAKNEKQNTEVTHEEEYLEKPPLLDIENDDPKFKNKKSEDETSEGHYKGKIDQGLDIENDEQRPSYKDEKEDISEQQEDKDSSSTLSIEDDEEGASYKDQKDIEEDKLKGKEKRSHLNIVQEEEEKYLDEKEDIPEEQKENGIKLEIEDQGEELTAPIPGLDIEDESNPDERQAQKADEIDKYMRSDSAKKDIPRDNADEDTLKERKEDLPFEDDKESLSAKLDIEKDTESDEYYDDTEASVAEEDAKDKIQKIDVLIDEQEDKLSDSPDNEQDHHEKDFQAAPLLDVEEEMGFKRSSQRNEEDKKHKNNRSNAKADKIETHYSSKNSVRHDEQDWENKWDKPIAGPQDDFKKKEDEPGLVYEDADLGEQTIDYSKLKDEFGGFSYEGGKKKKKIYGEFDNIAEIKTFTKTIYNSEAKPILLEFEEINEEEIEVESKKVFEPMPVGMDIAVKVLNFYMNKEEKKDDIYAFIAQEINKLFGGKTSFYSYQKETSSFEQRYAFNIDSILFEHPIPLTSEEKAGLSRAEITQLEKEYENEMAQYQSERIVLQKDYDALYSSELSGWQEVKVPKWKDQTFQVKENNFIFPYYDGPTANGYAVVLFDEVFDEEKAKTLEMILESARGVLLNEYYGDVGLSTIVTPKSGSNQQATKKKGFFGNLFGKIAG